MAMSKTPEMKSFFYRSHPIHFYSFFKRKKPCPRYANQEDQNKMNKKKKRGKGRKRREGRLNKKIRRWKYCILNNECYY